MQLIGLVGQRGGGGVLIFWKHMDQETAQKVWKQMQSWCKAYFGCMFAMIFLAFAALMLFILFS